MKNCSKCQIEQSEENFYKCKSTKDGLENVCKNCRNEKRKTDEYKNQRSLYDKERYEKNKDKIAEQKIDYYMENKEKISKQKKEYCKNNKEKIKNYRISNKEKFKKYEDKRKVKKLEYYKLYYDKNKDKIMEQKKIYIGKYMLTERYKITKIWRTVLYSTLKRMNTPKSEHTDELLGYSSNELKKHLESLFTPEMSWNNYGEWHVDHIIPVSQFNPDTPVSVVCSLNNLQPLWATTREIENVVYEGNLNKGNKNGKIL